MVASVRLVRFVGPSLLLAGVACLIFGYLRGEASLSLFVIFPIVTATGGWSALGILLIIAGFFGFVLTGPSWAGPVPVPPEGREPAPASTGAPAAVAGRRWGGVVFLGPVPVVFGSDAKIARWMILVGLLLFVGLVVLTVISVWGI